MVTSNLGLDEAKYKKSIRAIAAVVSRQSIERHMTVRTLPAD
jgi:hypothetical protein